MKKEALDSTTKISQRNLARIQALKISGYEPNDFIISQGLLLLEQNPSLVQQGAFEKPLLKHTTKISKATLKRIADLKISGYEPNDLIISKALDALEMQTANTSEKKSHHNKNNTQHGRK